MKISRLHIDKFAREEFPTIKKENIGSEDLLIQGGNRSGKTLTFNALLYGLYGPKATFGVAPGRHSEIQFYFDNDDNLNRGSGGREYTQDDDTVTKKDADEKITETIGPEELVSLQFLPSEANELPLSNLSGEDRIAFIRRIVDNDVQAEIDELTKQKEDFEREIEQIERTELEPRQEELQDIDIGRYENRLEKIEHLQSLINSGRLKTIKQRLQDNEEIQEKVNDLYDRKRTIEHQLRKLNRKLGEERRYTQRVNEIIVDAIKELTCPVCDEVVREKTVKQRLGQGRCPHCGQDRSIDEVKGRLKEKVDTADDTVEELEEAIEELREEQEEIEDKIQSLKAAEPDLSELNDLARETLEEHDYDLDAVAQRTEDEFEQYRAQIDELQDQKDQLEVEISEVQDTISELEEAFADTSEQIEEVRQKSFNNIVETFRKQWSENYHAIAPELALDVELHPDGTVVLPGNDGPRTYDELSTGEVRLLNLSFVYTFAKEATDSEQNGHNWEVIALDEPFANIDEETQENALAFIRDSDFQFIITTSNEAMERHFDPYQVKSLSRIQVQYTLEDFEEVAADD